MTAATHRIDQLIQEYLQAFNETNASRRAALIREVFTDDCSYIDPTAAVEGPKGVDGFIAAVQSHYPGVVFQLAGRIDSHHDQARFTWHAGPSGAAVPVAIGFDVVVLAEGKIRSVYGFLDKAPGA